jgi:hypothetical protein
MSGGRSEGGAVVEERREEIIREGHRYGRGEFFEKKTLERRELSPPRGHISYGRSRSVGPAPIIVDAHSPVEIIERSNNIPVGPLVLIDDRRSKDDRAIRAEIKALELERADRIRRGELVVYEERGAVRREREPDGVIEIKRDKKGRMNIIVPRR